MSWDMGPFDPFESMFDFDGDGELNAMERATEYEVLSGGFDNSDDSDDDLDLDLELAGLDRDDLMFMDEDERREALEDAGLDPDDYDDF